MEVARRFSDHELTEMHDDVRELKERFDRHEQEETKKFDAMIDAVNHNTKSIESLTEETRAIVDLHRDLQGTARVGKSIQSFLLWCTKWGAIGVAFAAVGKWIIEYFGAA